MLSLQVTSAYVAGSRLESDVSRHSTACLVKVRVRARVSGRGGAGVRVRVGVEVGVGVRV